MKKIFLLLLLSTISIYSFAQSYVVNYIGNSCAPWDGSAIYFSFKNEKIENETINISIWRWRKILPTLQTRFDFNSKDSYYGMMNICKEKCKLLNGHLILKNGVTSFKDGDNVEGTIYIYDLNNKEIYFKNIIKLKNKINMCG